MGRPPAADLSQAGSGAGDGDTAMGPDAFDISGGDYRHGGAAADALKQRLKQVGAAATAVRRAVIAAYEAEMNVVVHAERGTLRYALHPDRLDVEVDDVGPGIPDVARAMEEGFSTAPEAARALGFGAGMGLPNIRRNCDRLDVRTAVGRGTRVTFSVFLLPQPTGAGHTPALRVDAPRCTGCLRCLAVCPTGALRVRDTRPALLPHRCVDCGACVAVCAPGALALPEGAPLAVPEGGGGVLAVPAAFFAQLGAANPPARVRAALAALGFPAVALVEDWEDALRAAAHGAGEGEGGSNGRPHIAPLCPAVVNLVELRFPALLPQLAPYRPPVEALRRTLGLRPATFAVACPAQWAALRDAALPGAPRLVSVAALRDAVWPLLRGGAGGGAAAAASVAAPAGAPAAAPGAPADGRTLRVTGLRQVLRALEALEDGRLPDVATLELWACADGCLGGPLFEEIPAVAARYLAVTPVVGDERDAEAAPRPEPFAPRPGLRLDEDMAAAIAKLARLDALRRRLPGRDCGRCGAPTCAALAEDVVLGRGAVGDCPFAMGVG